MQKSASWKLKNEVTLITHFRISWRRSVNAALMKLSFHKNDNTQRRLLSAHVFATFTSPFFLHFKRLCYTVLY
jgi:hypothetical protein